MEEKNRKGDNSYRKEDREGSKRKLVWGRGKGRNGRKDRGRDEQKGDEE